MAWSTKLVCGSRELDLSDQWKIAEGGASFTPSKTVVSYGGMSPWQEGARRTSSFHENQEISLSLNIRQQSGFGTLTRIIRDLQQFFEEAKRNQEQGARDPVYLVRQADEGFTGTVLFGRGALYHEVLHGELNMPQSTYSTLLRGGTPSIVQSELNLTCMPFAVGKPTFCAEATGYVRFDTDNDLEIYGSASNFLLNPGLEYSVFDTKWNAQDATISASVEYERVHSGFQAARVVNTGTSAAYYSACLTFASGSPYLLSGYVYLDGASNTANDIVLYAQGGSISTSMAAEAGSTGWTQLTGSFAGTGASAMYGVWEYSGKCATLDDFLIVSGSWVYPYFDGSLGPGLAWDGVSACSQTTLAAGQWRLRTKWDPHPGYETLFYGKGAISMWVKTPWIGEDGINHTVLECAQTSATINAIRLLKNSSNVLNYRVWGSTSGGSKQLTGTLTSVNWAADTWHHIFLAWDKTGPTSLYLDNVQLSTSASSGTWTSPTQFGSYWYLGSDTSGTNQFNGTIADVRIFGPDAVVTVADLYAAGRGKSELGALWTVEMGGVIDNAYDASNNNYFYLAGVPGDDEAPLRLIFSNTAASSYDNVYWGMRRTDAMPYHLTPVEFSACAVTACDARSASNIGMLSPSATTDPGGTSYSTSLLSDHRLMKYVVGNYKLLLIGRDRASSTGIFKVRGRIIQNVYIGDVGEWVSSGSTGNWMITDLGTFSIPAFRAVTDFADQNRQAQVGPALAGTAYYPALFDFQIKTSTTGSSFDTDFLVPLPADMCGYMHESDTTLNANAGIFVIDNISRPPRSGYSSAGSLASGEIILEPFARVGLQGNWPSVFPHSWAYGLIVWERAASDHIPSDSLKLYAIYQARFGWGR